MTILHTVLSHTLVWKLGWVLIHSLWLAAAVTAALGVALTLLRKASSNVRYLVACGALILMVVLPTATFWMVDAPACNPCRLADRPGHGRADGVAVYRYDRDSAAYAGNSACICHDNRNPEGVLVCTRNHEA